MAMEERIRRLNQEYGFKLSEEEMRTIARRTEEFEQLFQCLYEVDLAGVAPLLALNPKSP